MSAPQGIQKKTRKFATVKRIIGQRDARLKKNQLKGEVEAKKKGDDVVREMCVARFPCLHWQNADTHCSDHKSHPYASLRTVWASKRLLICYR